MLLRGQRVRAHVVLIHWDNFFVIGIALTMLHQECEQAVAVPVGINSWVFLGNKEDVREYGWLFNQNTSFPRALSVAVTTEIFKPVFIIQPKDGISLLF